MKWKALALSVLTFFGNFFPSQEVQASGLQLAGKTDCGILYVNVDETSTLKKDGAMYLSVVAEEKYTDTKFLEEIHKDEDLKEVVGAMYLYLFDNRGSSYCIAANYLIDAKGKVCLDYGANMQMQQLTAKDKTLMNAYTISLKALENKNRWKNKFRVSK